MQWEGDEGGPANCTWCLAGKLCRSVSTPIDMSAVRQLPSNTLLYQKLSLTSRSNHLKQPMHTTTTNNLADSFSVRQVRHIVRDMFHANPVIYWTDLIITITVGYGCAVVYLIGSGHWYLDVAALFVAGFALFRAGSFIHEIQHFPARTMRPFVVGWNILCGIPLLMPSFFYNNHVDHHSQRTYGTKDDGEYLPLGTHRFGSWFLFYVLQAALLPIMVWLRFLIGTPVSFLLPNLRFPILKRYSFLGINPYYKLSLRGWSVWWTVLEIACCFQAWQLIIGPTLGVISWWFILRIYALAVLTLGLNYVRNLVAHHYRSEWEGMSYTEQLLDSVNITGDLLFTELFFPLGLRYHALHHLLPTLPYHNLGKAHRMLMDQLPEDSPYRLTVYPTYFAAVRGLMQDVSEARSRKKGQELLPEPKREDQAQLQDEGHLVIGD